MVDRGKVQIERLTTGIPRMDDILEGGFPKGSLNVIAGGPGVGKSIMTLQMLFHQARQENKSVYFVTISEPSIKFIRYMQQFDFFDRGLLPDKVEFFDLSTEARGQDPLAAIETVRRELKEKERAIIAIDSFKALRDRFADAAAARSAFYDLVTDLGVWGVTAFLVGEYDDYEIKHLPEFFSADGIITLSVASEGFRAMRQLEVLKLRGSRYVSGVHFFDITSAGIVVYPRITVSPEQAVGLGLVGVPRLSTGVSGLDEMMGGGLPSRSTALVQGASGTGKTLLALSFLVEGARRGEPGLFFTLEETREQLFEMGTNRGWPLDQLDQQGLLRVIYLSPIELAADAVLQKAKDLIDEVGAKRAAIDSLSSLDLSLGSQGRLRELVYALVKTFRMKGVTTILTHEVLELVGTGQLSGFGFSSIVDNIILLRYVELEARLTRAVSVLKMRGAGHDHVLRELKITADSIQVQEAFQQFRGVLAGLPTPLEGDVGRRRRGKSAKDRS